MFPSGTRIPRTPLRPEEGLPLFSAIDVGSNAMRLVLGYMDQDMGVRVIEDFREAVRLGHDVFHRGVIGPVTRRRALQSFRRFREVIERNRVQSVRAVATSALREARNREAFLKQVREALGFPLEVISAEQEALLVCRAVARSIPLEGRTALLVDIGGGSVEMTLTRDGRVQSTQSYNMGAVRFLQVLERDRMGERRFHQMVQESLAAARRRFRLGQGHPPDLCVGTGGNLEALLDFKRDVLRGDGNGLGQRDLARIVALLRKVPFEKRVERWGMRPDRADVIVPAAMVLQSILHESGCRRILIPGVGLKEGILLEMMEEWRTGRTPLRSEEVLDSARRIGEKYRYDEAHARTVARFSVELFDRLRPLHRLGDESRLLLEAAAWMHDVGQFIADASHHKHSYYLIRHAAIVGLDEDQREVVANVARYHRKSLPRRVHENYRALAPRRRMQVARLAALLRLADAMDHEHESRVRGFTVTVQKPRVHLRLHGRGDLLLERWSLRKKRDLFEKTYGFRLEVGGFDR
jgi:exopolyphosphatase/guanosine-5'-triphosphate,3'-diphosphate pyrophosphatase